MTLLFQFKSAYSTSDDNLRTSFSSESGNSTGGGGGPKEDDEVFDNQKSQLLPKNAYPVDNRIEKQEVNNNISNNENFVENSQKEPILQPVSEPEKLVSKEIDVPESSIPETNNGTIFDLQPQVASVTMTPAKSERTNARTDKGNKVTNIQSFIIKCNLIFNHGLKSSYDDVISTVNDFLTNEIQALQH